MTVIPLYMQSCCIYRNKMSKQYLGLLFKGNHYTVSSQLKKNLQELDGIYIVHTIWLCDTGQRRHRFDSCQLIITWMSNINDTVNKRCMPKCQLVGQCTDQLVGQCMGQCTGAILRRRHCRTSYSPRNYDTSHDDHEEMQDFYFYVCPLWLSNFYAYRAPLPRRFGLPELRYQA